MPMKFQISVLVLLATAARFWVCCQTNFPCWQEMDILRNEIASKPQANEIFKLFGRTIIKMESNLMSTSGLGPKNCPQASCKENFELPFCVLLTNQKHVKFLCFQVTVNEINFLVEISSRLGLTQGLYPIRGPKIVQWPYVNEISNFSSSTVGNSSKFLSVLLKQSRTK